MADLLKGRRPGSGASDVLGAQPDATQDADRRQGAAPDRGAHSGGR
jgi:hypothetical protein